MSVSPLAITPAWVDAWGAWTPYGEVFQRAIEQSPCHACRLALIPAQDSQIIPASGRLVYNATLVAGSIIEGFWMDALSESSNDTGVLQITDVATGHRMFQEPLRMFDLNTQGAANGWFPSYTLWPRAFPIIGGHLTIEIWGTPGERRYIILLVSEVTGCPVK